MNITTETESIAYLRSCVRNVPDFPKPGILFKDITPLLHDIKARSLVVDLLTDAYKAKSIDAVAGIEARGFLFGMMLADRLQVPFVPIRKAGKLPYHKRSVSYSLEYGSAAIEVHDDAIANGSRILIHDDVLATGGTAAAAAKLVQATGGVLAGFSFIIDLTFLPGSSNLSQQFGVEQCSLLAY